MEGREGVLLDFWPGWEWLVSVLGKPPLSSSVGGCRFAWIETPVLKGCLIDERVESIWGILFRVQVAFGWFLIFYGEYAG